MSKFIITYTPCFRKNMLKELLEIDKSVQAEKSFSDSTILIVSNLSKNHFINKLLEKDPIFIKHCMPVMFTGTLNDNLDTDRESILEGINSITNLDGKDPFAVQCRIISGGEKGLSFTSKDIEVFIGQYYEKKGNIPTFSDDNIKNEDIKVLSIFINKNRYFLGFSTSKENLNFHCDEYRIASKKGREISRAENKLKEALAKFNIQLSGEGFALDIGAAPGGWTKVLADYGYNVIAVDPGDLNPELKDHPRIKHYKCRIEELEFDNYFDIIVNDMNVDPQVSANIMNKLANTLKENGLVILTLKLPGKVEEDIEETRQILDENYETLSIKSLFHNRQEVTSLLKRKPLVKILESDNKKTI